MTSDIVPRSRLQDANVSGGFPAHIAALLNPGAKITCKEFLCRLVHVCMVEVGFLPVTEGEDEYGADEFYQSRFSESVPMLIKRLEKVIAKTGSLQSVVYKAMILQPVSITEVIPSQVEMTEPPPDNFPDKKSGLSLIPVTGKPSGDGSSNSVTEAPSLDSLEVEEEEKAEDFPPSVEYRKTYSQPISVGMIYDGGQMIVIATGPGFHTNAQVSIFQYIHTRSMTLPTATMEEYLTTFNFSPCQFVNDIKRRFCYIVMDEIDGLSFDLRSLAWLPRELIVEVAKQCSPAQVFRLRATCHVIRNALGKTNGQFWRFMLVKDFPQYHLSNLTSNPKEDKYYEKYCDLCKFTFRRPVRRMLGGHGNIPLYMYGNFPNNW